MSTLAHTRKRTRTTTRPAWSGLALVVEAITLLLFLVGSLSILTKLFAAASARGEEGRDLAAAVSVATTTAERFAADPTAIDTTSQQDGLTVTCDVEPEQRTTGTLYHATITVFDGDHESPLYVLETACYEREGA